MEFLSNYKGEPSPVLDFAARVWSGVRWISKHLIGQWDWDPPVWIGWVANRIRAGARIVRADWRIGALAAGGYEWYRLGPRPHYIDVTLTVPGPTDWDDNGRRPPKPLLVDFADPGRPPEGH
jgi:hypothetical protein